MIACPHCRHPHSIVLETREHRAGLYRRRQCVECGERFTTLETHHAARRGRPPGGGGTTLPAPTPERRTGAHRSKQK